MHYPRTVLLITALLAMLIGQGAAQTPSFYQTPAFPGGNGIAVADFNHDGILDVATSITQTGCGCVFFGNGDGTFRLGAQLFPVPLYLDAPIATADFNGDGIPDVLLTGLNNTFTLGSLFVFLGKGDGTFKNAAVTDEGTLLSAIAVGDVNGDGKPDVVGIDVANSGLWVYLGNGDGTFTALTPDFAIKGQTFVLGDFRGDGKLDIAILQSNGLAVALGNGDGTFQAPIVNGTSGDALVAGDFNGDGKLDLALASGSSVAILLGNGDGTFQAAISTATPFQPSSLATGDFNGDGKLDLFVDGGFVAALLGNGDGTFMPNPPVYLAGGLPAVGDLNNDHKLDVVTTTNVLIGNGDGTFQAQLVVPATAESGQPGVTADFNNDGKPDMAVVDSSSNTVQILLNSGTGLTSVTHSYSLPGSPFSIAAGDVNGDGNIDLLIGVTNPDGKTSSLLVMLGKGDGTFGSPTAFSLGSSTNPIIAVGDFNGDHNLDVAAVLQGQYGSGGTNSVLVLLGNGDGTFKAPASYYAGLSELWLALADFNRDGNLDIAVANSAGAAVLLGKGDGTFDSPIFTSGASGYIQVNAADVNGDGIPDLIAQFYSGGAGNVSAQVLLGKGDGTFSVLPSTVGITSNAFTGYYWTITTADLTGDGKLDLVDPAYSFGLSILPGNGDGTFGNEVSFPGSVGTFPVVADFNLDGKPDVAVVGNSGLVVLYNTTQPDFQISAGKLSPTIVTPGNSATSTVTVTALNGFDSAVTLSCSGLPTGVGCTFNPTTVPKGSVTSTLTITASSATAAGTYVVTVTGTSGALIHSTSVSLLVQDFTISAKAFSPASISPGASAISAITVEQENGFNLTVTLSCSSITLNGSPATTAPPSCSFNPTSISGGGGFSTLTVSTTASSASLAKPWLRLSGPSYALWLPIAGMALLGGFGSRKKKLGFLLVLLALSGLMFLAACGGGGGSNGGGGGGGGGTPAGTYSITVTGTFASTVHSTTVTLTVE